MAAWDGNNLHLHFPVGTFYCIPIQSQNYNPLIIDRLCRNSILLLS